MHDKTNDYNLHAGHRKRLRQKFLSAGLDAFADHEVLELLLQFSIPRKDTNELAHILLDKYGSFDAVLDQDIFELQSVSGIGESSALFLSLLPHVMRKYNTMRIRKNNKKINSAASAGQYACVLMQGLMNENIYVVCLDSQFNIINAVLLHEGTIGEAVIYPREVVKIVLRNNASSVILAHNHPGGSVLPSKADVAVTKSIMEAMRAINVDLLDHIIVSEDQYFSFASQKVIDSDVSSCESGAYVAEEDKE